MPYRNPNSQRIRNQLHDHQFAHAGQVVTWRQYVSASAGVAVAGFDDTPYYREQSITAIFRGSPGNPALALPQQQTPAGMIEAGTLFAITSHPLGLRDELVWRGQTYRIESQSVPASVGGVWISQLSLGIG